MPILSPNSESSNKQQLFQIRPPLKLIIKCVQFIGFSGLKDKHGITRNDMELYNIQSLFRNIADELSEIYKPNKFTQFCTNLTVKSCITITRQLLKTIGYELVGKEIMLNNKKTVSYKIMTYDERVNNSIYRDGVGVLEKPILISFD
jgi:hypothetical protein